MTFATTDYTINNLEANLPRVTPPSSVIALRYDVFAKTNTFKGQVLTIVNELRTAGISLEEKVNTFTDALDTIKDLTNPNGDTVTEQMARLKQLLSDAADFTQAVNNAVNLSGYTLSSTFSSLESTVTSLQDSLNDLEGRVTELEGNFNDLNSDVTELTNVVGVTKGTDIEANAVISASGKYCYTGIAGGTVKIQSSSSDFSAEIYCSGLQGFKLQAYNSDLVLNFIEQDISNPSKTEAFKSADVLFVSADAKAYIG
jgi:ABC-type transporter Mla subunit MlaD